MLLNSNQKLYVNILNCYDSFDYWNYQLKLYTSFKAHERLDSVLGIFIVTLVFNSPWLLILEKNLSSSPSYFSPSSSFLENFYLRLS